MVASAARDASELTRVLNLRCLIGLRLVSAFIAYSFLSVCIPPLRVKHNPDVQSPVLLYIAQCGLPVTLTPPVCLTASK